MYFFSFNVCVDFLIRMRRIDRYSFEHCCFWQRNWDFVTFSYRLKMLTYFFLLSALVSLINICRWLFSSLTNVKSQIEIVFAFEKRKPLKSICGATEFWFSLLSIRSPSLQKNVWREQNQYVIDRWIFFGRVRDSIPPDWC